jgi:transposase
MLPFARHRKIFVATERLNGRLGIRGLSTMVQSIFQQDPQHGSLFLFFSLRGDILRVLGWDSNGFCLLTKRLEKGRFAHKIFEELGKNYYQVEPEALAALLAGLAPDRSHVRVL